MVLVGQKKAFVKAVRGKQTIKHLTGLKAWLQTFSPSPTENEIQCSYLRTPCAKTLVDKERSCGRRCLSLLAAGQKGIFLGLQPEKLMSVKYQFGQAVLVGLNGKPFDQHFQPENLHSQNNYHVYEDSVTWMFIDPEVEIDLQIIKDKLLSGFDASIATVLYVDKKLKDHSFLQAIACVNRIYSNKNFVLVVDYMGIFKKLNSALDLYSNK